MLHDRDYTSQSVDRAGPEPLAGLLRGSCGMIAEYYPVSDKDVSEALKPAREADVEKQLPAERDERLLCAFAASYAHWLVSFRSIVDDVVLAVAFALQYALKRHWSTLTGMLATVSWSTGLGQNQQQAQRFRLKEVRACHMCR